MRSAMRSGLGIAVVMLIGVCIFQETGLAGGGRAWYVSASSGEDATGTGTPFSPLSTIQAAIDRAADGDTIKVASGTYYNISLSDRTSLVLLGGYDADFDRDVYNNDPAIITDNGTGLQSVVEIVGSRDVMLDGFIIFGGNVGVYSLESDRVRFTHSIVVSSSQYGILIDGGGDIGLLNNFVLANFAYGIGVYAYDGASILIGNNTILGNSSSGIVLFPGDYVARISSNIVAFNLGYGIEQGTGEAKAAMAYNQQTAEPKIIIVYNDLWKNNAGAFSRMGDLFDVDDINRMSSNTGNIEEDPLFVNLSFEHPENMDFHLQPNSPAIDAGDPNLPFTREPAPNGGRVNMGAFGNTRGATTSPVSGGPNLLLSERGHDFGGILVYERSQPWMLTLSNQGDADLDISDLSLDPPTDSFDIDYAPLDQMDWTIPPGKSVTLPIVFVPQIPGTIHVVGRLQTNDPDEPIVEIKLSGTGIERVPDLVLSGQGHDFGTVEVGQRSTAWELILSNGGTADLDIGSVALDPEENFEIDLANIEGIDWSLPPKERGTVRVYFKPTVEGAQTSVLKIWTNDPDEPLVQVKLAGTGGAQPVEDHPRIAFSGEQHDFGDVTVGGRATWELMISNEGTADLSLTAFRIEPNPEEGIFTFDYSGIETLKWTLTPGARVQLPVFFEPKSEGPIKRTLRVLSQDPLRPNVAIPLTGNGVAVPMPAIALSEESHRFGEVVVGDTSSVWELYISNSGTADLVIDVEKSKVSGPFDAIYHGDLTISPGARLLFSITFLPISTGEQTGQIAFVSNDPNRPTVMVSLSGTGIQQDIQVSENTHDFGSVEVGSSKDGTLTIQNVGTAPLGLQNVSLPEGSVFSLVGAVNAQTIQPGGTVDVKIRCTPSALGSAEDQLTIQSDDPDEGTLQVRLTGIGVDTTPSTITFDPGSVPEPRAGTAVRVQATLSDAGGIAEARLFYRVGGKAGFRSVAMTSADGSTFSAEIPAALVTARGIVYYLQATDAAGNIQKTPEYGLRVAVLKVDRPKVTRAAAYQMFSVPLHLQKDSPENFLVPVLGAYDNTRWRLFTYQSSGYVEYPAGNIRFQPGRAFWLITKTPVQISSGPGLCVPPDQPFRLTLQPGWNMVGNPFPFSIDWAQIPHEGKRIEAPWDYDGTSFKRGDILRPWYGYAVKNLESSPVPLLIVPREAGTGKPALSPLTKAAVSGGWVLRLEAQVGRFRDVENYLGCLPDAAEEWDPNEWSEPPPIGKFVSIRFDHTDWERYPGLYTTDFRPLGGDHAVWDFEVETNIPSRDVHLTWTVGGTDQGSTERCLVDLSRQTVVDLAETDSYTFFSGPTGESRPFRLFVGGTSFVTEQTASFAAPPRRFTLRQNIPNPFNSTTTISFEVPPSGASDQVTLRILDLLGRTVRTLFHGRVEAGVYTLIWDGLDDQGRPVSSGVYLIRMEGKGFSATKKMSLLR